MIQSIQLFLITWRMCIRIFELQSIECTIVPTMELCLLLLNCLEIEIKMKYKHYMTRQKKKNLVLFFKGNKNES